MRLSELLKGCRIVAGSAAADLEIGSVCTDSRQAIPGCLFVALAGASQDGHRFVAEAIARGAVAVAGDDPSVLGCGARAAVQLADGRRAAASIAAAFHGHPSRRLAVWGFTGTNGKTTCCMLCEGIARTAGISPGVIGTVEHRWAGISRPALNTTPGPLELQGLLRRMADAGVGAVFAEVTSHALTQSRIHGVELDGACFTNLTRDHLDYHGDMESYLQAKLLLFSEALAGSSKPRRTAVVNIDDPCSGRVLAACAGTEVVTWALDEPRAMVRPVEAECGIDGIRATLATPRGTVEVESRLIGRFNLANICSAAAVMLSFGVDPRFVEAGLRQVERVPGRMERVSVPADDLHVFVDYAHTPDAVENALSAARGAMGRRGRLIALLGCGGDRDAGKRPMMGAAAARLADGVVLTSDNPRSEDPERILDQIEAGVTAAGLTVVAEPGGQPGTAACLRIADRGTAIRTAILSALPGDTLVLLGKGHEPYQIVGPNRLHFDDREQAREALAARRGAC